MYFFSQNINRKSNRDREREIKIIKPINFLHSKFSRETILQIVGLHACSILKKAQPIQLTHTHTHPSTHVSVMCTCSHTSETGASSAFLVVLSRAGPSAAQKGEGEIRRGGQGGQADQALLTWPILLAMTIDNGVFCALWQAAISRETIWATCLHRLCDLCDFVTLYDASLDRLPQREVAQNASRTSGESLAKVTQIVAQADRQTERQRLS